ncbi:MAG: carboxypeptidase-like regulatory domain-containing protein [Thermoplasmata archaeon]|nr:carboxypeptidase-like regulatory domain-containing protein [Thermoplasmata archaeon]
MKWVLGVAAGCLILAALAPPPSATAASAAAPARPTEAEFDVWADVSALATPVAAYLINGTVSDSLTHSPVPGAIVRASSGPSTTSAANGSYNLTIQSGPETLTYTHAEYRTRSIPFNLVAPRIVNARLVPFNWTLSGSVLDAATSTPIIGAVVTYLPGGVHNTTNGLGQYRLPMENGTYTVSASAPGFQNGSVVITMNGSPLTKFVLLAPAGGGGGGNDGTVLVAVGVGVAVAVVALAYLILRSSGGRFSRRRPGPLAGIPGERDPNAPAPTRSADRSRYPPRRRT